MNFKKTPWRSVSIRGIRLTPIKGEGEGRALGSSIVLDAALTAVRVLEAEGIEYALIGGLALPAWGRVRGTLDVDALIACEGDSWRGLAEGMQRASLRLRNPDPVQIGQCQMMQLFFQHPRTKMDIRVDLFAAGTDFHLQALKRKCPAKLGEKEIWVLSCEDLILMKVLAGRPIDGADARELYAANVEHLDLGYLRLWSERLRISDDLTQIIWRLNAPASPLRTPPSCRSEG